MYVSYLSQIKHSQISVHVEGFLFLPALFIQVCCIFELTTKSQYVCKERFFVLRTSTLPLL